MMGLVRADYVGNLLAFCSKEETRRHLGGVYVGPNPKGGVECCATDGARAAVFWDPDGTPPDPPRIISREVVRAADLARPKKSSTYSLQMLRILRLNDQHMDLLEVSAADDPHRDAAAITDSNSRFFLRTILRPYIDGEFPAYRKVFPPKEHFQPGSTAAFNGHYLADFMKVGRLLDEERRSRQRATYRRPGTKAEKGVVTRVFPTVTKNDDGSKSMGPAIVRFHDQPNFCGVIMPTTSNWLEDISDPVPDWLRASPAVEAAKAAIAAAAEEAA